MSKNRILFLFFLLAFTLRMALGAGAYWFLPIIGYDGPTQKAGYQFYDAYRRDTQAWHLAQSDQPLTAAFSGEYAADQYGGLLWMSAFTYRYLTGGTHQPLAVTLLAALTGAAGIFFVFAAARRLLDEKSALIAAAIFAFFPEAILLGASQMREPFLMTALAIFFYASTRGKQPLQPMDWFWLVFSLGLLLFISPGIALLALVAVAGWAGFSRERKKIHWPIVLAALGVFLLGLITLSLSWENLVRAHAGGLFGVLGAWARETAVWNAHVLKGSSGIVQVLFASLPPGLALPFVAFYGILQPVLPAALLEPSLPFWQTLGIFRALGWYLLLPFLAYAPFAVWKNPPLRWLSLLTWCWVVIAAIRGGGDQWDNPRYRVIALVWLAILSAYALAAPKSRWFWRIVFVEAVLLVVFGHWYGYRYLQIGFNVGIRNSLALALGLAILGVVTDWLWEYRQSLSVIIQRLNLPQEKK